jgi:hypothetical protein
VRVLLELKTVRLSPGEPRPSSNQLPVSVPFDDAQGSLGSSKACGNRPPAAITAMEKIGKLEPHGEATTDFSWPAPHGEHLSFADKT